MNNHFQFTLTALIVILNLSSQAGLARPALPNDVRWVRNSTEYKSLCDYVFRKAAESVQVQMDLYASTGSKDKQQGFAAVVDLDETVLDNSLYQVERWKAGLGFTQASWSSWVKRKEAKLISGAKSFLDSVRNEGVQIVFLSNRMNQNLKPTQENLLKLDVLKPKDIFLLRQNKLDTKEKRRAEVLEGRGRMEKFGPLNVIVYLGDQMGDFPQEHSAEIGRKYFLLPNPMYGKW
jgi:5'-nucleotidase (lipoprotein e(P4) family)